MIEIKKTCDFSELYPELWSGAVDTVNDIIEIGKTDELMYLLEDLFSEPTDITTINDFLWFDRDYIFGALSVSEDSHLFM